MRTIIICMLMLYFAASGHSQNNTTFNRLYDIDNQVEWIMGIVETDNKIFAVGNKRGLCMKTTN